MDQNESKMNQNMNEVGKNEVETDLNQGKIGKIDFKNEDEIDCNEGEMHENEVKMKQYKSKMHPTGKNGPLEACFVCYSKETFLQYIQFSAYLCTIFTTLFMLLQCSIH